MRKEPVYHQDCEDESIRLTKEDKKMLIELICDEQTRMIVKDHTKYHSKKYKNLEVLKIKIKEIEVENYD